MKNMTKYFAAVLAVSVSFLPLAHAQNSSIVKEVKIKNNKAISEATITAKIKTKAGGIFDQDVLNEDLKRLYAMGYFTDVSMDVENVADGVIVSILVVEKPIVDEILFKGNKGIPTRKLEKPMQIKKGEMLNYSKLAQDINELKSMYSKEGFQNVSIKYDVAVNKDNNTAKVTININEQVRLRIKKVTVEGNTVVKSKVIMDMMATRPAWLFLAKGYFDETVFDADIQKIKRYYQSLGYLDADVGAEFSYEESKGLMYINLKVTEGKLYNAGKITIKGNLVFPEPDVVKNIKMKTGKPFDPGMLRSDMDAIREFYYEKGYMNVEIDADRKVNQADNTIDVGYTIDAKNVVYVGKIDVKGNTKTKDVVIRRELRIYPGEKFDGKKLTRSKERLYNLGFFEDIYFDTVETANKDIRDLVVSVKESKTGEFAFGGGYSSIDEFIGFVQVTQRNFDLFNWPQFTGDGQDLSIRASLGTVRNDYELSWTEPWIFDMPVSFGFDLYNRLHSRKSSVGYGYEERRTGGDFRLGKELLEYLRTDLMYKLENIKISDLPDDATEDLIKESGENWVSSLMWTTTFDTRDNVYVPTKGVHSQVVLENAGGFLGGDKNFVKGFLVASYYHAFYEKVILELKGRLGLGWGYSDTKDIPIYDRYYAGGAETIRGYKERRVGPRDPGSNTPLGGEAMNVYNAEVTFPLYEKVIKGAVFYDVGNVWDHVKGMGEGGLGFKQGAGCGIRVKTPIGPLKLDMGYPLSDNHDDKKQVEWYFSMSHGF